MEKKAKLCYMDTDSFIVYMKRDDIYKNIAEDVEIRFQSSIYKVERPLTKRNNGKVVGFIKDELGGKIMTEFKGLRAKTYNNLIDDDNKN